MSHSSNQNTTSPQSSFISAEEEKRFLENTAAHYDNQLLPSHRQRQSPPSEKRMLSPRRLALAVGLGLIGFVSLTSALAPRMPPAGEQPLDVSSSDVVHGQESDSSSLSNMLKSASPDVLHRLLHSYFPDRYKHGVYPSDHDAIAAVHADEPKLATALVHLARRQTNGGGNSTTTPPDTTSEPPPDTTSNPPESSSEPPPTTNPPESSSSPAPSSSPSSSNPPEPSSSSAPPPESSTSASPSPTVTSSSRQEETSRVVSSSPVATTRTSTKPNGEVELFTQTSWVVVGADETDSEAKPTPSLQNAAPRQVGMVAAPALIAAVAGALFAL